MKKSAVKPKEYNYSVLKSLEANTTVDVYGAVKFVKQPFKTRGKDHCMVVTLVDSSYGENEKLKCLLFNSDPDKLPKLNIGDIARFHRLKITLFNNEFQGQNGPGFSFVVFSNKKDAPLDPLCSSSSNYNFTDTDQKIIENLRKCSGEREEVFSISLEDIGPRIYFDFVCQVVATCYFEEENCFVLRVWDGTVSIYNMRKFDFVEENFPAYDEDLMKKADGFLVDVALYDDHSETARNKYKPGDFVKLVNLHAAIYKNVDTRNTDFPTIELVLHRGNSYGRGIMLSSNNGLIEHLSNVGRKDVSENNKENVRTVKKTREQETIVEDSQKPSTSNYQTSKEQGSMSSKSIVQMTNPTSDILNNNENDNTNEVSSTSITEQKSLDDNVQLMEIDEVVSDRKISKDIQNSGTRCMQQTVTIILGHHHIKVTKIMDVLQTPPPKRFRILGHVEGIFPNVGQVSDFLKLYCETCHYLCSVPEKGKHPDSFVVEKIMDDVLYYHCPACRKDKDTCNSLESSKSEPILKYIYMMRIQISDGTGSLDVLIWGKEAVKFFRDIIPDDLLSSKTLWHDIKDELKHMCSIDKPLLECCIKSYTVEEDTKYQIFDTSLV